jgi:hypothetical protein
MPGTVFSLSARVALDAFRSLLTLLAGPDMDSKLFAMYQLLYVYSSLLRARTLRSLYS